VTRLQYTRTLATDDAIAWSLLADPAAMSTWSTAPIVPLARGDGDHPGGTGALRRVHAPGGATLTEVIERADAPHRLEYRVIAGAPVRDHHGSVEIAAGRMTWTIDFEAIAGGPIMRALLDRELTRSLDRLVAIAPSATLTRPLPPPRDLDRDVDLPALRRVALAIATAQAALADDLEARQDPRAAFARVYHHVTATLCGIIDAGRFDHPAWVYRLIPLFDRYFTDAIAAPTGTAEPHWQRAFAHLARVQRKRASPFELAMHAVYAGMRAHIEDDLPRVLGRVWADHYGPRDDRPRACDPARFRADYLRMRDVFQTAGDALMAGIPRRQWTLRARAIDALTPDALRAGLVDRYFYPITRERAHAFDRGVALAELLAYRA
jgi:uncharacterized protein YndB with AHSA1/START domain